MIYEDEPYTASEVGYRDQAHASIRDLADHLRGHIAEWVDSGRTRQDAAMQLAYELWKSDYSREALACLAAQALATA